MWYDLVIRAYRLLTSLSASCLLVIRDRRYKFVGAEASADDAAEIKIKQLAIAPSPGGRRQEATWTAGETKNPVGPFEVQ